MKAWHFLFGLVCAVLGAEVADMCGGEQAPRLSIVLYSQKEHSTLYFRNSLRTLMASLQTTTLAPSDVQLLVLPATKSSPSMTSLDALYLTVADSADAFAAVVNPHDELRGDLPLATCFNYALNKSCGENVLFLDAQVDVSMSFVSDVLSQIEKARQNEFPSIHGCLLYNPDGNTVFHVGADFELFKMPAGMERVNGIAKNWPKNVPMPVYTLQGASRDSPKVAAAIEGPFVIGKECFFFSKETQSTIGYFDENVTTEFVVPDYALRIKSYASEEGELLISDSKDLVSICKTCTGLFMATESLYNFPEWSEADVIGFLKKWREPLQERILKLRKNNNTTVVWNMECGSGQTLGFTTEAISWVLALKDVVSMRVEVTNIQQCKQELEKARFPVYMARQIVRLNNCEVEFRENSVLFIHRDPGRFRHFVTERGGQPKPKHCVGRSMYETNTIPLDWPGSCNSGIVQKIYVPSAFNMETFYVGGVNNSLLDVLPDPLDTDIYTPGEYPKLNIPGVKSDEFVFLTVSKWETRKGLDTLIKAFIFEFGENDNAVLVIRSNMDDNNVAQFEEYVEKFSEEKLESDLEDKTLPRKPILMREMVPLVKMPNLYKSADAFVMATHGEGWGLPLIEAMAMGVPTIATNWSGITEFAKEDTAYLIPVGELVDVPDKPGQKWAMPSFRDLRRLMREVYTDNDGARAKTENARAFLEEHFSLEAVQDLVLQKLAELEELPEYHIPIQVNSGRATTTASSTTKSSNARPTRIKINP